MVISDTVILSNTQNRELKYLRLQNIYYFDAVWYYIKHYGICFVSKNQTYLDCVSHLNLYSLPDINSCLVYSMLLL